MMPSNNTYWLKLLCDNHLRKAKLSKEVKS